MILSFVLCFLCFLAASPVALVFCVLLDSNLSFPHVEASWFLGNFCSVSEMFMVTWYFL